eukprot:Ihof_evm2s327 gene=Ihof_evmTU2s327
MSGNDQNIAYSQDKDYISNQTILEMEQREGEGIPASPSVLNITDDQILQVQKALIELKAQGKGLDDPRYRLLLRILKSQDWDDTNEPTRTNQLTRESISTLASPANGNHLVEDESNQLRSQLRMYRLLTRDLPIDQNVRQAAGVERDKDDHTELTYPKGLDPLIYLSEREHAIHRSMGKRQRQLQSLPNDLPPK